MYLSWDLAEHMAWPLSSPTELLQVHFPYLLKYLAAACSPSSSQADNELSPTDRYSKISQFPQLYLQVRIALQIKSLVMLFT